MAILHPMQDSVTMAAEAGTDLLQEWGVDRDQVGQLTVATETGVDWAKPIASWVHGMLGLGPRCRTFDVQHACYGASAALSSAFAWVSSGLARGRKALVIATDVSRYDEGSPGEATQGAGAVALLVGMSGLQGIFHPDLGAEAVHTSQVMDFWRPGYRMNAVVNGRYSVKCYLTALAQTYRCHLEAGGAPAEDLDYLLFHLPFPRMADKALATLLEPGGGASGGAWSEEAILELMRLKVAPGLRAAQLAGNSYSASLYLGLASLLESEASRCAGRTVGLFSYGSGSCAEFFTGTIGEDESVWAGRTGIEPALARTEEITVETYRRFRSEAVRLAGRDSYAAGDPPCVDTLPPDARFVFLGYSSDRRIYARGPASVRAIQPVRVDAVSSFSPRLDGPAI